MDTDHNPVRQVLLAHITEKETEAQVGSVVYSKSQAPSPTITRELLRRESGVGAPPTRLPEAASSRFGAPCSRLVLAKGSQGLVGGGCPCQPGGWVGSWGRLSRGLEAVLGSGYHWV